MTKFVARQTRTLAIWELSSTVVLFWRMISPLWIWGNVLALTVLECSSIRIEMYESFSFFFLCYYFFFSGGKIFIKVGKKFLNWKVSVLNNAIVRRCNKIQIARMRKERWVAFSKVCGETRYIRKWETQWRNTKYQKVSIYIYSYFSACRRKYYAVSLL